MVYKRVRGWTSGRSLPVLNFVKYPPGELDMITRDLECPSHDNSIIRSYDVTGADFKNSPYVFGQSEKSYRVQCIIILVITNKDREVCVNGTLIEML